MLHNRDKRTMPNRDSEGFFARYSGMQDQDLVVDPQSPEFRRRIEQEREYGLVEIDVDMLPALAILAGERMSPAAARVVMDLYQRQMTQTA